MIHQVGIPYHIKYYEVLILIGRLHTLRNLSIEIAESYTGCKEQIEYNMIMLLSKVHYRIT